MTLRNPFTTPICGTVNPGSSLLERAGFERVHSVARHGAAFFRALKARTQCGNKRSRGGRGKGVARRYHTFAEQSHAKPSLWISPARETNRIRPTRSLYFRTRFDRTMSSTLYETMGRVSIVTRRPSLRNVELFLSFR